MFQIEEERVEIKQKEEDLLEIDMPSSNQNKRLLVFFTKNKSNLSLNHRYLTDAELTILHSPEGITLPSAKGAVCIQKSNDSLRTTITKQTLDTLSTVNESEKLQSCCGLMVPMVLTAAVASKEWLKITASSPEMVIFGILAGEELAKQGVTWKQVYCSSTKQEIMQKNPELFQKANALFTAYLEQNRQQFAIAVDEAKKFRQGPSNEPDMDDGPPSPRLT